MPNFPAVEALDATGSFPRRTCLSWSKSDIRSLFRLLCLLAGLVLLPFMQLCLSALYISCSQAQRRVVCRSGYSWCFHQTIEKAFVKLPIEYSVTGLLGNSLSSIGDTKGLLEPSNIVSDTFTVHLRTMSEFLSCHRFAALLQSKA